ncbi:hypothetical protein DM793_21970 [Paenarthrobacter nitroguajacolicus]|nr:hypothetical protein [Paenarthrobacter nitroguajacolicus]
MSDSISQPPFRRRVSRSAFAGPQLPLQVRHDTRISFVHSADFLVVSVNPPVELVHDLLVMGPGFPVVIVYSSLIFRLISSVGRFLLASNVATVVPP